MTIEKLYIYGADAWNNRMYVRCPLYDSAAL